MPMLRLAGVEKRFGASDWALRGVDLEVRSGEIVAIIGASGAGKSTLIRCINRLVEPTAGRIEFEGRDVARLGTRDLRAARRRMGMIFQAHALVDRLTVLENALSGRLGSTGFWRSALRWFPERDLERARSLLEAVGLQDHAEKRADALSGGQRQRVGIARALMQDPVLLLVDEPTASLDPGTARVVMKLIADLCRERGLTAVINSHDVALARDFAGRIVGLREGRVVWEGAPAELAEARLLEIYGTASVEPVEESGRGETF